MAVKVFIGSDGNYAANANWSPTNVPTTGDHVRIPAGAGNITTGLDQSAVAIGDFIVEAGYTGTIGTSSAYLQIDPDRFEFSGTGVSYIDIGSAAISPQVFATAAPAAVGLRGLYLKGSAIVTGSVVSGKVGLAVRPGETSTATTMKAVGPQADLWIGKGCSLTNAHCYAGKLELRAACTTVKVFGGNFVSSEVGAITTATVEGGVARLESTGTVGTLNSNGGSSDLTGSGASRTVSLLNLNGGTVKYDPSVVTMTDIVVNNGPVTLTATAA